MLIRLAPLIFVLLWSTGYIGAKLGTLHAEPLTFLSVRFLIVVPIMMIIAVVARANWPSSREAFHSLVAGFLIHGVYLGGVFWAIDKGMSAGVSALIVGLQPVTTAVLAVPLLGERITARHSIGLLIGLAGVTLVLAPGLNLAAGGITTMTISAVVVALLSITLGTIYQKRFSTATDLRTGAVWQYIGALIAVGPAALLTETGEIAWAWEFIVAMTWLVLVLSIGAVSLLMLLLRQSDVSQIAALFYLVPAVVAVMAWFLFGETFDTSQAAGIVLVAVAVILVTHRGATKTTGELDGAAPGKI